jgi:hypothetical protein
MRRSVITVVGVLLVTTGLFGVGTAAASGPDVSGETYGKASSKLSGAGWTPVIASVVGDQLATDDCIVTSSAAASNLDSSGRSRGSQMLLNLNCNQSLAAPGKPGNSAASPEGKQAKVMQDLAGKLSRTFDAETKQGLDHYCSDHSDYCTSVCKQSGVCGGSLLSFLGL